VDSLDEFLFALHPDFPEHAARHLAEHILHQIEPGAVLRNEDELKALRPTSQVALRFLGDRGGVIVENQSQRRGGRIGSIQLFQQLNEVLAPIRLADDLGDRANGADPAPPVTKRSPAVGIRSPESGWHAAQVLPAGRAFSGPAPESRVSRRRTP
jgi:hypothetical protein